MNGLLRQREEKRRKGNGDDASENQVRKDYQVERIGYIRHASMRKVPLRLEGEMH